MRGVGLTAAALRLMTTPVFAHGATATWSGPNGVVGPGCSGSWHSYNAIVPAFGIGTYLTGPAYSFKGTDVSIGVSSMNSGYNNRIYAQATDESGNQITAYVPIAEYQSYDLWYNQSGGQYVRVGFATERDVFFNVQVQGQWSADTDC